VPDFYQGSELWDLSLVDPDNRRPVDFASRRKMLDQLRPILERAAAGRESPDDFRELLDRWPDGRIKLLVTTGGLRLRRSHPELFLDGAYLPIDAHGPASGHLVAFGRRTASAALIVAVPRLVVSLMGELRGLPIGEPIWGSTSLALPDGLPGGRYRHVLTGETLDVSGATGAPALAAAALFRTCPVALLEHVE
jgi:(1->4)-alpha-D-glucan 1-alpha-D-glucosylmutase